MSTWVFLRGLTRECRHWGSFPETFQRDIPGATVHRIDLPGNGILYQQKKSPLNVAEMAESCRADLAARGVPPPYHLLAMSLGAMVAIDWASRHPEEISGCVLINTSLRSFSAFHQRLKPGNYVPLLRRILFRSKAEDWERTILHLTSRHPARPSETIADWVTYRQEFPVSTLNACRQLLAAARYQVPPNKPAMPILVLSSQKDGLVDPRCSQRLARHWDTAFAEHPTAGHDIPLDDGPWVSTQVKAWLQALPSLAEEIAPV